MKRDIFDFVPKDLANRQFNCLNQPDRPGGLFQFASGAYSLIGVLRLLHSYNNRSSVFQAALSAFQSTPQARSRAYLNQQPCTELNQIYDDGQE